MFRLKLIVIVASAALLLVGSGVAMAATGHMPAPVNTLFTNSGSNSGQSQAVGSDAQPQAGNVDQAQTGNVQSATPAEETGTVEGTAEPAEKVETTEPAEKVETTEPAESKEQTNQPEAASGQETESGD